MPAEIKLNCECGHSTPISKSNISAHRKTKVHLKNMAKIGNTPATELENTPATELENTIVCPEIVINKPAEKVVKPKCIKCNKRQISKDWIRKKFNKCNKCFREQINQKFYGKNEDEEEEEEEVKAVEEVVQVVEEVIQVVEEVIQEVEEVKPVKPFTITLNFVFNILEEKVKAVEEVIPIVVEEVKPVKPFTITLNFDFSFLEEAEEEYIKKNYSTKIVKPVKEIIEMEEVKPVEEVIQPVEEVIQAVEEIIQTIEVEPVEEVIQPVEEVIQTIEVEPVEEVKPVYKKLNHKEIDNSNWFEYIPDNETYSTSIIAYIQDNLKIDKRIIEFLKVRYIYIGNTIKIQIFASDDITDKHPISFHQCNTKEEHFTGNANAFSIFLDPSIEFKADFLKKKKYNNFSCRRLNKVAKKDDDDASIFFKIEEEILKYSSETHEIPPHRDKQKEETKNKIARITRMGRKFKTSLF